MNSAEELCHSSGPWKKHKYFQKIGEGANAVYKYAKKTASDTAGKLTGDYYESEANRLNKDAEYYNHEANRHFNLAVKDAAKKAGLNRIITEIYYIGTERKEESHKFCEIISNHDARRTFVSCSLAMGIPAETVMKCTGHKSYNTMKPYIETATETQALEMEKWNKNQYRSQIINLLNTANEDSLRNWLHNIQTEIAQKS